MQTENSELSGHKKRRRVLVNLILLLVMILLVLFIFLNREAFEKDMLVSQYFPKSPSYLSVGVDGTLYVVVRYRKYPIIL